jgi:pyridoxal phosphate enzyme (YggS family)
LLERSAQLDASVRWHLIGHLQRNKARRILPVATLIHSVDSIRLLTDLERLAGELDVRPRVLLEVNVTGEASKAGFAPPELEASWEAVCDQTRVRVEGLMTMAPFSANPDDARPAFRDLRDLRDRLAANAASGMTLSELSMGMTGDFEVAIEEGATLVRIGSALFDGLSS